MASLNDFSEEELLAALKAAHAAKDVGAATRFAEAVHARRQATANALAHPLKADDSKVGPVPPGFAPKLLPQAGTGREAELALLSKPRENLASDSARALIADIPGADYATGALAAVAEKKPYQQALDEQRLQNRIAGSDDRLGSFLGTTAATATFPFSRAAGLAGAAKRMLQVGGLVGATKFSQGASADEAALEGATAGTVGLGLEGATSAVPALFNSLRRGADDRASRAALKLIEPNSSDMVKLDIQYGDREAAGRTLRNLGVARSMPARERADALERAGEAGGSIVGDLLKEADAAGIQVDEKELISRLNDVLGDRWAGPAGQLTSTQLSQKKSAEGVLSRVKAAYHDPPNTPVGVILPGEAPGAGAAPSRVGKTFTTEADAAAEEPWNALYEAAQKAPETRQIDPESSAARALARKARLQVEGPSMHWEEGTRVGPGRVFTDEVVEAADDALAQAGRTSGGPPPLPGTSRARPGGQVVMGDRVPFSGFEQGKRVFQKSGFERAGKFMNPEAAEKDDLVQFYRQGSRVFRDLDEKAIDQMGPELAGRFRAAKQLYSAGEDFAPIARRSDYDNFTSSEGGMPRTMGNPRYGLFRALYGNAMSRVALPTIINVNERLARAKPMSELDPTLSAIVAALQGEQP